MSQSGGECKELDEDLNDVPPLEDMSVFIQQAKVLHSQQDSGSCQVTSPSSCQLPNHLDRPAMQSCDTGHTCNGTTKRQVSVEGEDRSDISPSRGSSCGSGGGQQCSGGPFGGLKKGFLLAGVDQPSKKASREREKAGGTDSATSVSARREKTAVHESSKEILVIQPKGDEDARKKRGRVLELPEVQEAMKESLSPLASQEWVTPELLSKIEQSPVLSKALQDPHLAEALAQLQANPQAMMAAASKSPKLEQFLREFCALMGEHFTALTSAEEKRGRVGGGESDTRGVAGGSAGTPLISECPSHSVSVKEDAKLQEILSTPEVQSALLDKEIQELILTLKSNPDEAQRLLHVASGDLRRRVEVLIRHGVLGLQRS